MAKLGPFFIHDRASGQCLDLARFNHFNPRYSIVRRSDLKTVDEAMTRYEANSARANWNAGIYGTGD